MELHTLKSQPGAKKKNRRVGRGPGSGHGKTSGKGHKGQQARSGTSLRAGFEGGQNPLHRRLPKRGFNHAKRLPLAIINLHDLEKAFESGAEISTQDLVKAGLAKDTTGGVKLLARGEVTKKLVVKIQAVSESARLKIEAAGGSVEALGPGQGLVPLLDQSSGEKEQAGG